MAFLTCANNFLRLLFAEVDVEVVVEPLPSDERDIKCARPVLWQYGMAFFATAPLTKVGGAVLLHVRGSVADFCNDSAGIRPFYKADKPIGGWQNIY